MLKNKKPTLDSVEFSINTLRKAISKDEDFHEYLISGVKRVLDKSENLSNENKAELIIDRIFRGNEKIGQREVE